MTTRIRLQEAFKFGLSMALTYWLALWMDWDLSRYSALAIVLVSLSTSGASIMKGIMRVIGTIIAVIVGLLLISWFSQERWNMMFAIVGYLIFVSYFMQTSRYPYAWYVAGFVPMIIWADTYGQVDNSFHFAVFRLLETASGVMIYSLVSVLLWPQTNGDQFYQQGGDYLGQLGELFKRNIQNLCDIKHDDLAAKQRKLDVLFAQLQATLGSAVIDTTVVKEHKHNWRDALLTLRSLTDSLVLWRETNKAYLRCEPTEISSDIEHALTIIEQRCYRIAELWRTKQLPSEVSEGNDTPLLQTLSFDLPYSSAMSNIERGLQTARGDQLRQLDQQSQKLLILLRVLTGLDTTTVFTDPLKRLSSDRVPRWDSVRLLRSLAPGGAFIVGFLFWIFPITPPPGGQSIPQMSAIFALIWVRGENIRYLGLLFALGGLIVAPFYFVVMPWLEGGFGLIIMIFLLSFVFGFLSQRWPMFKLGVMIQFVMMTSIANEQSYSFIGWVNTEFVNVVAAIIANGVIMFMVFVSPEKIMSRKIHGFFNACAGVSSSFVNLARKKRKEQHFMRVIRVAPKEMRTVENMIDYGRLPGGAKERINSLLNSVESLSTRLIVLEGLMERVVVNGYTTPLGSDLPRRLHLLFKRWIRVASAKGTLTQERNTIEALYHELSERVEKYNAETDSPSYNEQLAIDFTALLGGVHGLLEVIVDMDQSMSDIHWKEWKAVDF